MRSLLHRYWIEFDDFDRWWTRAVGVTAFCKEDALELVKLIVFDNKQPPKVRKCTEDIDVSTLDLGKFVPNLGDVTIRGVWHPNFRFSPKLAAEYHRRISGDNSQAG